MSSSTEWSVLTENGLSSKFNWFWNTYKYSLNVPVCAAFEITHPMTHFSQRLMVSCSHVPLGILSVCHAQHSPVAVISSSSRYKKIDCSEVFTMCISFYRSKPLVIHFICDTISVSLLNKFPCQHQLPRQTHEPGAVQTLVHTQFISQPLLIC